MGFLNNFLIWVAIAIGIITFFKLRKGIPLTQRLLISILIPLVLILILIFLSFLVALIIIIAIIVILLTLLPRKKTKF